MLPVYFCNNAHINAVQKKQDRTIH
jgi:hypothetical protein